MKKLQIVEIENSYLNFFTPAAIVAAGLFLFNLIVWPLSSINWFLAVSNVNLNVDFIEILIAFFVGIFICYLSYFQFIPRLKVKYTDYIEPKWNGLFIVVLVFNIVMFFRILLTIFFEYSGTPIYNAYPWFMGSYSELLDPLLFYPYLLYQFLVVPISSELIYRRIVIPLLEDRGASPLLAVILSSLGFCLLLLPQYLNPSNILGSAYWFMSTFLFGLATGIIYVLTRNILFSILYSILYYGYRIGGEVGNFFSNKILTTIHFLINLIILCCGILLLLIMIWYLTKNTSSSRWVSILKTSSAPRITKGIVGYFIISIILVSINLFVITSIQNVFQTNLPFQFLLNTLFYLIAFSIPFWLSITTEYATS